MIPAGFIQELLSRVDIVDVVGRHVQLKKTGANLMGLCPFHGEKSPSFSVSPSKQFYYCFGCGASGDAVKFLSEHTGASFREAVADLAQQVGLQVPDDERNPEERAQAARQKEQQASLTDVLARAADHYRKQLRASPRAIDYLKGRGLTGEVAARFGLGYAPDGWRNLASVFPRYDDPLLAESGLVILHAAEGDADEKRYDRFRDRVMFPIRSVQGEVIGFGGRVLDRGEPKYLNSPETPVFVKGRELYGLFEGRAAMRARGYALVVEGYMDVVALAQLGFENAVATLGTACGEEHVRKLFRFTESVVFSFDGDAAGRRAASRAMEAALPFASDTRTIRFLFLPAEHDPDSYVREFGAEAFERCVNEALPLSRQMLDIAAEGCDLATPEGRARFLAQARPLWAALPPEGALSRQMRAEIARQAGVPDAELAAQWVHAPAPRGGRPEPRHDVYEDDGGQAAADAVLMPGSAGHAPLPGGGGAEYRPAGPPRDGGRGKWGGARKAGGWSGGGRGDWRAPAPPATPRRAPRKPEDRIVHMLLTHAEWWDQLAPDDLDLLHGFDGVHGELLRWLERDLHDHGARPWAVLRVAIDADPALAEAARRVLSPDPADDEAQFQQLRAALDQCLLAAAQAQMEALAPLMAADAAARESYRRLAEHCQRLRQRRAEAAASNEP
ncbi:DNA primase [Aquincola sp. J276]|uniref:DNA primase n=1 Tax=Aquincola sp. J276 TaxID=2898432 RepID=UPI002150E724|nr:DNA primase [Aquincola sp. J276]MCR5864720.1 DNA primase [Aquincola sp. J276]